MRSPAGSPPPMRGKANGNYTRKGDARITPAYAGKSYGYYTIEVSFQDHPRLCGEKVFPAVQPIQISGSPPPMRGKVQNCFRSLCSVGITPAYAGKRIFCKRFKRVARDHPRLCGEKWQNAYIIGGYPGSPPPMRGKVRRRKFCLP